MVIYLDISYYFNLIFGLPGLIIIRCLAWTWSRARAWGWEMILTVSDWWSWSWLGPDLVSCQITGLVPFWELIGKSCAVDDWYRIKIIQDKCSTALLLLCYSSSRKCGFYNWVPFDLSKMVNYCHSRAKLPLALPTKYFCDKNIWCSRKVRLSMRILSRTLF